MPRFHIPLIEPDVRFSRIRLSEKASRFRPRKAARSLSEPNQTTYHEDNAIERFPTDAFDGLCLARSHWRSRPRAC